MAAVVLGALLAGCTTDVDPTPVPVPTTTPAATPTTAAPPTTEADPVERLRAALLTPADAGEGYGVGTPPAPEAAVPDICGGESVVARFPDAVRIAVALEHAADGLSVQQTVSVYADPGTAQAAFDAGAEGYACGEGTLGDLPVAISEPADLRPDVGGERALGWQLGADGIEVLIVSVQAAEAVVTFAYAAPSGTGLGGRPDALGLTRTGVERILTA